MLKQNIDALKLADHFHKLSKKQQTRYSLLDFIAFLYINEHKDCGKLDIVEYLFYDRVKGKSSLDKPILRLLDSELIIKIYNETASTKHGDASITYSISKQGSDLLTALQF